MLIYAAGSLYTIVLALLALIAAAGLIFLIAGLIKKSKKKSSGSLIPAGAVCLAFDAAIIMIMIFLPMAAGRLADKLKGPEYDNITDKWRSELTTDTMAAYEARTALLAAADNGDRSGVAQLFTPQISHDLSFETALDVFMVQYPKGLSECKLDGGLSSSQKSKYDDEKESTGFAYYTAELNGEWYAIKLRFCYENNSPDKIGVTFFAIENLEANAHDYDYGSSDFLLCRFDEGDDARLIGGMSFIFKPYNREITAESFSEHMKKCRTMEDLKREVGEANVIKKYDNLNCDYYYELVPENGELRYAYISADPLYGTIFSGYICSDREIFFSRKLEPMKEN